jgi:hypothetical protein
VETGNEAASAGGDKEALRVALAQITEALGRHDLSAAVAAMALANELCTRLSQQGIALNQQERPAFESLAAACGVALDRAGRELHASSNQRENVRRGMNAYLNGP